MHNDIETHTRTATTRTCMHRRVYNPGTVRGSKEIVAYVDPLQCTVCVSNHSHTKERLPYSGRETAGLGHLSHSGTLQPHRFNL